MSTPLNSNELTDVATFPLPLLPNTHVMVKILPPSGRALRCLVRRVATDGMEVMVAVPVPPDVSSERVREHLSHLQRLAGVSLPELLKVVDAGSSDGWIFYFIEHVSGGSLANRLRRGAMDWEAAARLIVPLAKAVEILNGQFGLCHGDIHPDNIFLIPSAAGDETCKLGGFWLLSQLDRIEWPQEADSQGGIMGRPAQVPPALVRKAQSGEGLTFKEQTVADIFALGATFFETITGEIRDPRAVTRSPSAEGGLMTVAEAMNLPAALVEALRRACLWQELPETFATAHELALALQKAVPLAIDGLAAGSRPSQASTSSAATVAAAVRQPVSASLAAHIGRVPVGVWWGGVLAGCFGLFFLWPNSEESAPPVAAVSPLPRPPGSSVPVSPVPSLVVSDLDRLKSSGHGHGLSPAAARTVLDLNQDWFRALRSDPQDKETCALAEKYLDKLAGVGTAIQNQRLLTEKPHLASAIALASSDANHLVEDWLGTDANLDQQTLLNLLIQDPYLGLDMKKLRACHANQETLKKMMKFGLYGVDSILTLGNDDDEEVYLEWVKDLLTRQIPASATSAEIRDLLAILMEQSKPVRSRLKGGQESHFRARFTSDLWPAFLRLVRQGGKSDGLGLSAENFAINPGVWDVLCLPNGESLMMTLGVGVIPMFTGTEAFPQDDELRLRAVDALLTKRAPIVNAFLNPRLRQSTDFITILKKNLPLDVLAVVCAEINEALKSGKLSTVTEIAHKSVEHIVADVTGRDSQKWAIESWVPEFAFVRLGIKIASGDSLYDVQKTKLTTQAATDIVKYLLPVLPLDQILPIPVDPDFIRGMGMGIGPGTQFGENVRQQWLDNKRAEALKAAGSLGAGRDGIPEFLRSQLQALLDSSDQARRGGLTEITSSRAVFEEIVNDQPSINTRLDLARVNILRLPDGRLAPVLLARKGDSGNPPPAKEILAFFHARAEILAKEGSTELKTRAWQQMVSAWLLMGASRTLPSTNDSTFTSQH